MYSASAAPAWGQGQFTPPQGRVRKFSLLCLCFSFNSLSLSLTHTYLVGSQMDFLGELRRAVRNANASFGTWHSIRTYEWYGLDSYNAFGIRIQGHLTAKKRKGDRTTCYLCSSKQNLWNFVSKWWLCGTKSMVHASTQFTIKHVLRVRCIDHVSMAYVWI
jgi:hypothetical protein